MFSNRRVGFILTRGFSRRAPRRNDGIETGEKQEVRSVQPNRFPFVVACMLLAIFFGLVSILPWLGSGGQTGIPSARAESNDLPILQKWSGDYPVSELSRLPDGQRKTRVGFFGDERTFDAVLQAFKPGEKAPEVDFAINLVVFARNVDFYNRTSIARVILKDGVAEIIAIETRSAMPIEERVAMAMAVIPRTGVRFIKAGDERIPVASLTLSGDPLNATYTIEGKEVRLIDGHDEKQAAPGSATKIKTWVFGQPVYGDLNDNGQEDVALFLAHDPGGSGTFYYVAAALCADGEYRGTNGVLLGDRVALQNILIRNGVVVASYADRRTEEPMAVRPSIGKTKYLTVGNGTLTEIKPHAAGEQVMEGWVTIGHEARSFQPCSRKTDLWILGESPALKEIIAAHRKALPDRKRYAPLFMVLAGKYAEPPADGLGKEYDGAFFATQLVRVWPRGNCKSDRIVVDSPRPGALVTTPLSVRGQARGTWFFEGDFPLILKDDSGQVIARGFASAKGEWMTREFVAFEGTLQFKKPRAGGRGTLVLKKDNPTDLPEHDDALEVPIFFR